MDQCLQISILYLLDIYLARLQHIFLIANKLHLLQQCIFLLCLNAHTSLLLKNPFIALCIVIRIYVTFQIYTAIKDCTRRETIHHATIMYMLRSTYVS
jgi:hypothetical protein